MNIIEAMSASDLLQKLQKTNIKVPPRTKCCTKELKKQRETRIIYYVLATICNTDLLEYPLRVKNTERPDFLLFMPFGRRGVEIVEAVPETIARADAYSEDKGIFKITGVPHLKPGEPHRSRKEIKAIAKGTYQYLPYMGDSIERNWVDVMLYFSQLKAGKFKKPGFKKYDSNWLLIYDDWRPFADLEGNMVMTSLGEQLFCQSWRNPFERIFILRPRSVWEFCKQAEPVEYPILDLWHGV